MRFRVLRWPLAILSALLAIPLLVVLWGALFGWNWVRVPLQDYALRQTGRELRLAGDLRLRWAWPVPMVRAERVSFANPAWAQTPQMLTADAVEAGIDLPQLLHGRLAVADLILTRPHVALEQASGGRKTWLLDLQQTDEERRIPISRLQLDQGEVDYIDSVGRSAVHATVSTVGPAAGAGAEGDGGPGVVFKAQGKLLGQPFAASGRGGAVLAWRDQSLPYPLQVDATLGRTRVQASGTVTGLLALAAVDLRMTLRGDSLASLFPIVGIALPPTPDYVSAGRLVRSGKTWRYEDFTARVGRSDLAGSLQVDLAGARPQLTGALRAQRLALADLAPAVGAHPVATAASSPAPARRRLLPDEPFDTARLASLDADVTLKAQSLVRAEGLPLADLDTRIRLNDARLRLDPLNFGLAGGQLRGQVLLDSHATPLRGQLQMQLRGLQMARLLTTLDLAKASIGRLDGDLNLAGQGASVGRLLGSANGRVTLVAQNGQISRLLMEQVGLHLLEILQLQLTGDQTVALNCAVADFSVRQGVMQAQALLVDTAVNTLVGSGSVDLSREMLDLTIVPKTKISSLVALRGPIYVKGSFTQPAVALDTGSIAARGAGAVLLGLVNPLLALIPLFEAGPGEKSECARLVRQTHTALPKRKT